MVEILAVLAIILAVLFMFAAAIPAIIKVVAWVIVAVLLYRLFIHARNA
jgi:hypothetical protein